MQSKDTELKAAAASDELTGQVPVVAFLKDPRSYFDGPTKVRVQETHSAIVFLTGAYAYKLKKAVKFSFLDFTTLDRRRHSCEEELRLNSRFAPELYLEVLPISRSEQGLHFGAGGEIVDYVVKMRQFDDHSLFDDLAADGALEKTWLLQITDVIARFHLNAESTPDFWGPDYVRSSFSKNFETCRLFVPEVFESSALAAVEQQTFELFELRKELIRARQLTHVRELHGDLHLRNMCVFEGKAMLFDGIDFNPQLSHCDVFADFAFFVMDLLVRRRASDAALVWNRYLQETDDFSGLRLLPLYVSYRAGVRAMVSCLELASAHTDGERRDLVAEGREYLELALRSSTATSTTVVAVGGLAGSGKSTVSSLLAQELGFVHIRSDAVRKHLCGIALSEHAPKTAYSAEQTKATYSGLLDRARLALEAGYGVIIDAVYHSEEERRRVEELAAELKVPFVGLWCTLPVEIAKQRVRARRGDISDADESVVSLQETYSLGEIQWQRIDTSVDEAASLAAALEQLEQLRIETRKPRS
ncbi:MAG: AAA family ATPase [Bdellovibrionota bacterium]